MKKIGVLLTAMVLVIVTTAIPVMAETTTSGSGSVAIKYADGDIDTDPGGYLQSGGVSATFTGELKATVEDKVEAVVKFNISNQSVSSELTYATDKTFYGMADAIMTWYGDNYSDLGLEEITSWDAVIEGVDLRGYFTAGALDKTKVTSMADVQKFNSVVWLKIWKITDENKRFAAESAYQKFFVSEIYVMVPNGVSASLADVVTDAYIKLIKVGGLLDITAYPLGKTVSVGSLITADATAQDGAQPALDFALSPAEGMNLDVMLNQKAGSAAVSDDATTLADETAAAAEPILGYSFGMDYTMDNLGFGLKYANLGADKKTAFSINGSYTMDLATIKGEYTRAITDNGTGMGVDVTVTPIENASLGLKYLMKDTAFGAVKDAAPADQNTVSGVFNHCTGDISALFFTVSFTPAEGITLKGNYATTTANPGDAEDNKELGASVDVTVPGVEGLVLGVSYGDFGNDGSVYSLTSTYTITSGTTLTMTYGTSRDKHTVKNPSYSIELKTSF